MINAFCVSYFQNYDRFKKRRKKNSCMDNEQLSKDFNKRKQIPFKFTDHLNNC